MCFFLRGGSDDCYADVRDFVRYAFVIISPSAGIYGKPVLVKWRPVI